MNFQCWWLALQVLQYSIDRLEWLHESRGLLLWVSSSRVTWLPTCLPMSGKGCSETSSAPLILGMIYFLLFEESPGYCQNMCAFVETWWGCAGMCWPMIWTTSSDLDRLITLPSWEFFPWNSLNSPFWCVFDSSAVVALVHLFEERIHVGQGYAPPPRVTWSISFRWVTSLHEEVWFSGKQTLDFAGFFPFFPLSAQEQRGVKGHKKVWKSSVNWMDICCDQVHLLWARILMGFLFETHPQDLSDQRAEDVK